MHRATTYRSQDHRCSPPGSCLRWRSWSSCLPPPLWRMAYTRVLNCIALTMMKSLPCLAAKSMWFLMARNCDGDGEGHGGDIKLARGGRIESMPLEYGGWFVEGKNEDERATWWWWFAGTLMTVVMVCWSTNDCGWGGEMEPLEIANVGEKGKRKCKCFTMYNMLLVYQ